MSSNEPTQIRTVDPFASYNSDTVNKLTRMLTFGEDALATARSCDVSMDATSVTRVIVASGTVYKDDMWIDITTQHIANFEDSNHYYDFGTGFDEAGYYYIVMSYTYQRQRPAPQAKILIVKPTQRLFYSSGGEWIFLKAVHVIWNGSSFEIDGVSDYDPDIPANKRLFVRRYAGTEITLPTFDSPRDTSRILYVKEEDDYYFGLSDKWSDPISQIGSASTIPMNTETFEEGDLIFITSLNSLSKAIAATKISTADGVVSKVAVDGRIKTNGYVNNVKLETGIVTTVGDLLYLSVSESGKVTTVMSSPYHQFVGRCTEIIDSTSINMLFVRGEPIGEGSTEYSTYVTATLDSINWVSSYGLYYQDVNVSSISGLTGTITVWDSSSKLKIQPTNIEFLNTITLRIWMPTNTLTLHVLVIGPASNKSYASSITTIHENLSSANWLGTGPYYQNIDTTGIITQGAIVAVRDTSINSLISPLEIEFDATNIIKIWMPDNTQNLGVTIIGPTTLDENIYSYNTLLPSGASWFSSGGLYYQDISLTGFLNNHIIFEFIDTNTSYMIQPTSVEFISDSIVRIWMPTNTIQLNVTIIG